MSPETRPRPRTNSGKPPSLTSRSSAGVGSICQPLDDYCRYIIACKLCTTMKADDVAETLKLVLEASGCDRANVIHKPRLLSDNGLSYISGDLAEWLEG